MIEIWITILGSHADMLDKIFKFAQDSDLILF